MKENGGRMDLKGYDSVLIHKNHLSYLKTIRKN